MSLKFLMDVHVHIAVTEGLRRRGAEVLTVQEANMQLADDIDLLAFALRERWVIFTNDADFPRLHARGVPHGGIVYCHQQTAIRRMIEGLMLVFQVLEPEQMANHLEYI